MLSNNPKRMYSVCASFFLLLAVFRIIDFLIGFSFAFFIHSSQKSTSSAVESKKFEPLSPVSTRPGSKMSVVAEPEQLLQQLKSPSSIIHSPAMMSPVPSMLTRCVGLRLFLYLSCSICVSNSNHFVCVLTARHLLTNLLNHVK